MRLVAAVAVVALALTLPAAAAPGDWTPDAKTVARIEAIVRLPGDGGRKPRPLTDYARYYAGVTLEGRRVVRAEYVSGFGYSGVHIGSESDFPGIDDGGCAIVNLSYDVAAARIIAIRCNGYA